MKDILDVMIWILIGVSGLLIAHGSGVSVGIAFLLGLAKISKKDALTIGSWMVVIIAIIGLGVELTYGLGQ